MRQLGGDTIFLGTADSQLGRGETVADTARVLSRYVDAIMIRTNQPQKLDELARYATVPVINGLTDASHPCQIMADVMTLQEKKGPLAGRVVAWSGDGNNVAASWVHAAVRFGFGLRLASPPELGPPPRLLDWARREGGQVSVTSDPYEAVAGADCVVTDTWVSMGAQAERQSPQPACPIPGRRTADGARQARRHLHALLAGPSRRGGHGRGRRRPAIGRVGRGREPAARAKGHPRLVSGLSCDVPVAIGFRSPLSAAPGRPHTSASPSAAPDDLVQPFQLDPFALRGRLVRLGPTVDRILSQHDYPEPVATMLGEAITLAVLLAGALKYDGVFTLQTKGDGPVRLLVADVKTDGAVRGYAQYDAAKLGVVLAAGSAEARRPASVPRLLGTGYIAFTVDQGDDTDRYQGIVEITGATLAECAQHYFRQSEQLQAGIKLAVADGPDRDRSRGPGALARRRADAAAGAAGGRHGAIADDVEDAWRRVMVLMSSATAGELVAPDLPPRRLLCRLFHEDGVRVYDTHPLEARCRCSRERIATILRAFPADEIDDMAKERVTTVTCEFCSTRYTFDAAEISRLAPA